MAEKQEKQVTLTAPDGTKVTVSESRAEMLTARGYTEGKSK